MTPFPLRPPAARLPSGACALLACALLFATWPAQAGEGHDHGHDHGAAPAPAGPALPRFAAVSESFELVGVLQGRQLQLYLDRAPSNEPVAGAKLELEIAGAAYTATPMADQSYAIELPAVPAPGVIAVTATVTAGDELDLLAAELDLHGDEGPAEGDAHAAQAVPPWRRPLPLVGAGVAAALALAVMLWRRRAASSSLRAGGAA